MRVILNNFYLRNLCVILILAIVQLGIKLSYEHPMTFEIIWQTAFFEFVAYFLFLFHNLVLYEKLWLKKRYLLYVILLLITVVVYQYSYSALGCWVSGIPMSKYSPLAWAGIYVVIFMYLFLALGVYLAFTYSRERERLLQIEGEKKELELQQLTQQLNPHFLFNSLNNIYSHLLSESGNGRELILKLSELMRYILDSSKKDVVPAHEEVKFIEHYIAFEKERLGDRCEIDYVKQGSAEQLKLVPLILFNFVENAFKHGTTSIRSSKISIRIALSNSKVIMSVTNPVRDAAKTSTGIGLQNTRRRLDLLYPHKHKLDIQHTGDTYSVMLEINP